MFVQNFFQIEYIFIYKIILKVVMKTNNYEKTTLVVDGNWLLMGRQFMLNDQFSISNPQSMRDTASNNLADLMCQSISVCLRAMSGIITNVVFVSDGGSWRKNIEKPNIISEAVYKGTRSFESTTDWNAVWKSMNILTKRLKSYGMTVSNTAGAEGDDWCWWWSRKLNALGENVILWTIDEDIKQLITVNPETGCWTGVYEKRPGLVLPASLDPGEDNNIDDIDFFMNNYQSTKSEAADTLSKIFQTKYLNPSAIINKKIFVGDGGDNILPTFTYCKGDKTYKATVKDMEGLIDMNKDEYSEDGWIKSLPNIYHNIIESKKSRLSGAKMVSENDFIEHAIYNRTMVWLDDSQIPDEVKSKMSEVEYKHLTPDQMHDIRFNWKVLAEKSSKDEIESLFNDDDLPF